MFLLKKKNNNVEVCGAFGSFLRPELRRSDLLEGALLRVNEHVCILYSSS